MVGINVAATLGGAVLGAILGSCGTYLARERSRRNEQEERIENLRRSLVAELGSMDEFTNQKSSDYANQIPVDGSISTEVYRSNSSKISLLSPEEAEAVIRFYSGAIKLEQALDSTLELVFESEHPQMHDMTPLNESMDTLREDWKECVLRLLSKLDNYPSAVRIEGEKVAIDESMSTADLWIVLNYNKIEDIERDVEFIM